jgi:rhodanese-related sulfurtransferase
MLLLFSKAYEEIRDKNAPHILLDVRDTAQYNICALPASQNIPLSQLEKNIPRVKSMVSSSEGSEKEISKAGKLFSF